MSKLIKKYYDGMQVHDILCECLDDYDTILTILEKFADTPTIEVRPQGEWIKNIDGNYECSECHVVIRGEDKPIYPFCAWCGADMRGENNEID